MSTKVTFVELSAYEGVVPLSTGYLYAYAKQDAALAAECSFELYSKAAPSDLDIYSQTRTTSDCLVLADQLIEKNSDVYAISCYLWNIGINRWLIDRLHAANPAVQFILGGPQVMNHLHEYIAPDQENVAVCNGEGERTFRAYLQQVVGDRNFHAVPGLSFWRDGKVVTTPKAERIKDLNEIPSPYAAGLFDQGGYLVATLETNRGCPYNCGFCAWGAATNDKVYKFGDDRVRQDIRWISEHQFQSVFIADANWGISPRDIEFTKYFVEQKNRNGYPFRVDMAAAKNRPDRMAVISETLALGGLVTSQPISMQSLDSQTLDTIQRSNIRLSAYTELQTSLREKNINSHVELIWPLPGETLDSFKRGIAELCRLRADFIIVYPHILLHNTPIYRQRDALGVQTARVQSDVVEVNIITSTNWVTISDYEDGVWFGYLMDILYGLRGLYYLANYLDQNKLATFNELFAEAADYFKKRSDATIPRHFAETVKNLGNYDFRDRGLVALMALHSHRAELDELLAGFAQTQSWWRDENARAAFELDMLARPYIYAEPTRIPDYEFVHLRCENVDDDNLSVTVPPAVGEVLTQLGTIKCDSSVPQEVLITHTRVADQRMPYMEQLGPEGNIWYCYGMVMTMRECLPGFRIPVG